MPIMAPAAPSASQQNGSNNAAPTNLVPFVRAAAEHYEPFLVNTTLLTTTGNTIIPPADVPAYGYLRGIWIQVSGAAGSGGAVTFNEDAPFSAIQNIELDDVNGAPIVGPFGGYDLYLVHKYGGYRPNFPDARGIPTSYSAVIGTGAFSFIVRLPVEAVARDGLGALANANASSTYKLKITLSSAAPAGGLYIANTLTTQSTVTTSCWLDAWTQPDSADLMGNPQATTPPGNGTTQYWSKQTYNALNGFQTVRFSRVGNYIRNIILVNRDVSNGTRQTGETDFPDPLSLYWDTRLLYNIGRSLWRGEIIQWYGLPGTADASPTPNSPLGTAVTPSYDKGVFLYPFTREFDGVPGFELRDGYLPTVQSTRLEVVGNWGANSSLSVLTNDVSPAGDIFV
jgi:hypothetical protein